MKKRKLKTVLAIMLLSISMYSCVGLKSVNIFSLTSATGIKKFEELDYSFRQHCLERCQFELIKEFDIKRETDCDCAIYMKADSANMLIYNSIKGYLDGLTNLSGNNLTDFNINALKKPLEEGSFGNVIIEKKQVDACTSLLKIMFRTITDAYRKNKIKQYVEEANAPIQILLEKFQFILQNNLAEELDFKKERFYDYYMEMKMNNTLNDYEKGKATIDYYQMISDIDAKQGQINTFAKSLETISEGHQKLYDNRNKMSAAELKVLLTGYSSDIRDIISEFNKLKK